MRSLPAGCNTTQGHWDGQIDDVRLINRALSQSEIQQLMDYPITKYYLFGSERVAMRNADGVYYFHADHLGTANVTTDASGAVKHQVRHYPFGQQRWQSGTDISDFDFTGMRREAGGLLDYRARMYDGSLGRFLSADSVVPDFANPQDLNRYAYVRNSPLNFVDPSGHFTEDELIDWFGKNWREQFDSYWIDLLTKAELGDAILYNYDQSGAPQYAVFALDESNSLVAWDISSRSAIDIPSLFSRSDSQRATLYRPEIGNRAGGPSDTPEISSESEALRSRYYHLGDVVRNGIPYVDLPADWYLGPTSHLETLHFIVGFEPGFSDVAELSYQAVIASATGYAARKAGLWAASRAAAIEFGGVAGVAFLSVDLADWAVWDTEYRVAEGRGYPAPSPVPTPSRR